METSNLYSALVTVDCGNQNYQTGWFISERGHLLTAAHGLRNGSLNAGDSVNIVRQGDRKRFAARIIELGNTVSLDYAILQVVETDVPQFIFIPVISKWSSDYAGLDFYGGGYSDAIDCTPTEIDGKIISRSIRPRDGRIQLSLQTPFKVDGLSGCPIILCKYNAAVALQCAQPNATESMLLALPLISIRTHSEFFRKVLDMVDRESRKWDVFELEHPLVPTPKRPKREVRIFYCLHPSDPKSQGRKILEYLQENWTPFQDRVRATCVLADIQKKHVPELVPEFYLTEVVSPMLDTYFDAAFIGTPKINADKVRWVCDLSQNVNMDSGNALPAQSPMSHLVGVSIDGDDNVLRATKIQNLNCWFSLPKSDARKFMVCLFDIIEDLIIDSSLFYATKILSFLYDTIELRQAFSECKVAYAKEQGLVPYGLGPITDNLRYISFAGCCRSSFGGSLNVVRLTQIWHHFIDQYLLRSLQPREKASTPKLPLDLIFDRIVQTPKLGGQINRYKLRRDLQSFEARDGELCAVVLLSKRAKGKQGKILSSLFKKKEPSPNRARLCRQNEIAGLIQLGRYIHVFFFRWRQQPRQK